MNMQTDMGTNEPAPILDVQVFTQWTPNPNAYKFIVSEFVIASGKATFTNVAEAEHIPLVKELFSVSQITQVHFYENVVTVTQDGSLEWAELAEKVEEIIVKFVPTHNADFPRKVDRDRSGLSEEMQQIEAILDRTIRPGLQGDGGDVEVIQLDGNVLSIRYEGACGTCPSSMAGTLQAITSFLREEFSPDIEVVIV
jgi:Fe-S cluster biogenesis protein NfuA